MPSWIFQVFVLGVPCWRSRAYSGWFYHGGLGCFVWGFMMVGGFCPGGFVRGVLSGGVLSGGFCPGGFCPGGFVRGGFVRGGFVRGGFCPGGFVRGVLSGGVLFGGALSGGFCTGGFVREGFVRGGFVRGVLSGGVLSRGVCPRGGFVHRGVLSSGVLSGGFCPGGFVQGGFVLELCRYNNHSNIDNVCVSWRKIVIQLWKIPYSIDNSLDHLINNCASIDCILEKRCVLFLWNLFNSDNVLFIRIIRYSMHNNDTTISENVRYFCTYLKLLIIIGLM